MRTANSICPLEPHATVTSRCRCGGGHDWAGRALCEGIVIDLSGMNGVSLDPDNRAARISGGARASDVLAVTDPLRVAAVTGSVGTVGMQSDAHDRGACRQGDGSYSRRHAAKGNLALLRLNVAVLHPGAPLGASSMSTVESTDANP
jgi:hypothetical protein